MGHNSPLTTRQYARLVSKWVGGIGLDPRKFATHSMHRTKATLIYRRTGNLRVQLQLYNMWDAVQFTTMDALYTFSATGNTAPTTGQYTAVTNPLNVGLTFRLGF